MNKIKKIFDEQKKLISSKNHASITKILAKPKASINYIICFTPRSGSSWLGGLINSTNHLGNPKEWFSPVSMSARLQKLYPCQHIEDYLNCLIRDQKSKNGVFGFEVSFAQFQLVLELLDIPNFFENKLSYIYLYRRNLVAQAISLYRATDTDVFHSVQKDYQSKKDIHFSYNSSKIWHWLIRILEQEYEWPKFFKSRNITPLTISYEDLWAHPRFTVLRIINYLLKDPSIFKDKQRQLPTLGQHTKVSTKLNKKYIHRFYSEFPNEIDYCYQSRGILPKKEIKKHLQLQNPTLAMDIK